MGGASPYLGAVRAEHVGPAARSLRFALLEPPGLGALLSVRRANVRSRSEIRKFASEGTKQGGNNHQTTILEGVSEVRSTRFCLIKKSGLLTPGQSRSRAIRTRLLHFYVHFPQFGGFSGAERAQRRARARNRAKRVRGGMGVNSPSMKTHRNTQGLGWCIETRVWIPAFVLWTRR